MKIVKFRDWEFEVDEALTRKTYEGVGEDTCECQDCRNMRLRDSKVFPLEVLDLLNELGIDYRKPYEFMAIREVRKGFTLYDGWFHFAGKFLKGEDCLKLNGNNTPFYDYCKIDEDFKMGFNSSRAPSKFPDEVNIVQLDFLTIVEFVLDEPLEK